MIEFDFGELIPIVAIAATAWVLVTWMRWRSSHHRGAEDAEKQRLVRENEDLKRALRRTEERLGALERIVTDPAERTAREIEQLR